MSYVPQELSMIVSSNPANGATNRSYDGSSFEITLQDGLEIPSGSQNISVSVEEATVWWVVPNITDVNNKMYLSGGTAGNTTSAAELGYVVANTDFEMTTLAGETFSRIAITATSGTIPSGVFSAGYSIKIEDGIYAGKEYDILEIVTDTTGQLEMKIELTSDVLGTSAVNFSRIIPDGYTSDDYVITIPKGLYDLAGLNQAIARELEIAGARNNPDPLITLTPDESTQKVEIRFNYDNVTIDFQDNTATNNFREILGFDSLIYGPFSPAPHPELAPFPAAFNTINYFLIHSDLSNKGIRFNNNYSQTIAQVLINVSPGSQIVSTPFNPAKVSTPELQGTKRTNLRFWLTDDSNRPVDTNGEYWSARIVIRYLAQL
tara:strand:- start:2918 stop:4045 length:1128 start_codon:yes stop_codon:yes gene_type:complete